VATKLPPKPVDRGAEATKSAPKSADKGLATKLPPKPVDRGSEATKSAPKPVDKLNAPLPDLRILSAASMKPFTWVRYEVVNEGKADVGGDTFVYVTSPLSRIPLPQPIHRLKAGEKHGYVTLLLVDADKFKPDGAYEGTRVTIEVRMNGAESTTADNKFTFTLGVEPPRLQKTDEPKKALPKQK
jgi:hypothetical protein